MLLFVRHNYNSALFTVEITFRRRRSHSESTMTHIGLANVDLRMIFALPCRRRSRRFVL